MNKLNFTTFPSLSPAITIVKLQKTIKLLTSKAWCAVRVVKIKTALLKWMLKLRDDSQESFLLIQEKTNAKESLLRGNFSSLKGNNKKYFAFTTDPMQTIFYMPFMQIHTEEKKKKGKF
jgi:hypothetical protein